LAFLEVNAIVAESGRGGRDARRTAAGDGGATAEPNTKKAGRITRPAALGKLSFLAGPATMETAASVEAFTTTVESAFATTEAPGGTTSGHRWS
jgi:hypothetical protein